jgi:hypothetical protein
LIREKPSSGEVERDERSKHRARKRGNTGNEFAPWGRIPHFISITHLTGAMRIVAKSNGLTKGKDTMRRLLSLAALMLLLQVAVGCRHIGGECDCEHAYNGPVHAVPYSSGQPMGPAPVVSSQQSSPPMYTSNSTVVTPR